jgi:hypothetical protein
MGHGGKRPGPLCALALLCASLASSGAAAAPAAAAATRLQAWMVSRNAIDLINVSTGNTALTTSAFDVASTLQTGTRQRGWASQPTLTFTAFGPADVRSSLEYAIDNHDIPADVAYLSYDDEDWPLTPANERDDPGLYMSDFVTLAHAHGYKAILAPAVDLAKAMPCYDPSAEPWVDYVTDCNLPGLAGAAHPDVYEIQAQLYESGVPLGVECGCYSWLVTQSALEARGRTPLLEVLAGLTTNQDGAVSTPQDLFDDTVDTQASTDGYWLNVPQRGPACPSCTKGGAPQVAVAYLEMLGY